jgi:hypothetical protein
MIFSSVMEDRKNQALIFSNFQRPDFGHRKLVLFSIVSIKSLKTAIIIFFNSRSNPSHAVCPSGQAAAIAAGPGGPNSPTPMN